MVPITQRKLDIDIAATIRDQGVELRRFGQIYKAACPFHGDGDPSFVVYPESHRFHCFGCHESGDVIDFVQKLHGFNFPGALSYLGIENRPTTKAQYREIKNRVKEAECRRQRREARQKRERELAYTLGTLIRWINKARLALTPENLHVYGGILQPLSWLEWGHDTLINGDRLERAYVLWSFKGFPVINWRQIFRKNFDFEKWLKNFCVTSNRSADESNDSPH